jgi:hypothetical protein
MRSEIQETWRRSLVKKLQENYGLPADEAKTKVEVWLQWVTQGTQSNAATEVPLETERQRQRRPPRSRIQQRMTAR